jgi:hypothetical protein
MTDRFDPPPLYLPYLIASLVASAGIVIGSFGPWATLLVFNRTATDGDGMLTLVLGLIAAAALFVVLHLGRSGARTAGMRALSWTAVIIGMVTFGVGAVDAGYVTSRKVEWLGQTIGAQIGWGLWLVLIASLVLIVTAIIVVKQVPHGGDPALARWLRDRKQADLARWDREGEQKVW